MINPHDIKQPIFIKYCTRPELKKPSYLPPPPPSRYSASPAIQPTYNSNTQSSRQSTFTPIPPSSSRIAKVYLSWVFLYTCFLTTRFGNKFSFYFICPIISFQQQFRNSPTIFAGPPPAPITIRSKREPEAFESSITASPVQPSPSTSLRRQGRASWENEQEDTNAGKPHQFNQRSNKANEIRRSARSLYNWNKLFDTHPWIPILKTHRKKSNYRRHY